MKIIRTLSIGILSLVSASLLQAAPNNVHSAYRSDADVVGYFDLAAIYNSPVSALLREQVAEFSSEAEEVRKALDLQDEDFKELAFSVSSLNSIEEGSSPQASTLIRISKPITLEQIEQILLQNENIDQKFEKQELAGVPVLMFNSSEEDSNQVALASFVNGNETLITLASPNAFADIVGNKNLNRIPEFAQNASSKLSDKGQGFISLKVSEKMKDSIKEGLAEIANNNEMGIPLTPELIDNLHHLDFVTLGVSLTDKAIIELQGLFPNDAQSSAVSGGLAGFISMAQMVMGFAMSNAENNNPFIPSISQSSGKNTTSIKVVLTPAGGN